MLSHSPNSRHKAFQQTLLPVKAEVLLADVEWPHTAHKKRLKSLVTGSALDAPKHHLTDTLMPILIFINQSGPEKDWVKSFELHSFWGAVTSLESRFIS